MKQLSSALVIRASKSLGYPASKRNVSQIIKGMGVEKEHGRRGGRMDVTRDAFLPTLKIALAHLQENPDYYKLLEFVEDRKYAKARRMFLRNPKAFARLFDM